MPVASGHLFQYLHCYTLHCKWIDLGAALRSLPLSRVGWNLLGRRKRTRNCRRCWSVSCFKSFAFVCEFVLARDNWIALAPCKNAIKTQSQKKNMNRSLLCSTNNLSSLVLCLCIVEMRLASASHLVQWYLWPDEQILYPDWQLLQLNLSIAVLFFSNYVGGLVYGSSVLFPAAWFVICLTISIVHVHVKKVQEEWE